VTNDNDDPVRAWLRQITTDPHARPAEGRTNDRAARSSGAWTTGGRNQIQHREGEKHMTIERISTSDELDALSPDEIVKLDDAGMIDLKAIAKDRRDRSEASARQARQIGAQLRSGALSEDDARAAFTRLHDA
jgi:hypothetical protein